MNRLHLLFAVCCVLFLTPPKFAQAQNYIPLSKLCDVLAGVNEDENTSPFRELVVSYGYSRIDLGGIYIYKDSEGNKIDVSKFEVLLDEYKINISYDFSATAEHTQALKRELDDFLHFSFSSDDKTTYYYNTWNGRFNLILYKKNDHWYLTLYEYKPNIKSINSHPAVTTGPGKLYINSYTNSSPVIVHKGDKIYLHNTGNVNIGSGSFSNNCGPEGCRYGDLSMCLKVWLNNGALLTMIDSGEYAGKYTEAKDDKWLPAHNDTMLVAPYTGILKFEINDTDPEDNSGNFVVEYSINKPLPYAIKPPSPKPVVLAKATDPVLSPTANSPLNPDGDPINDPEKAAGLRRYNQTFGGPADLVDYNKFINFSGTWSGKISDRGPQLDETFVLYQYENQLSGTCAIQTQYPNNPVRFHVTGWISDNKIYLFDNSLTTNPAGGALCQKSYAGAVIKVDGIYYFKGSYSGNGKGWTFANSNPIAVKGCDPGTFNLTKK